MKQIWAPWRMEYLKAEKTADECIFCTLPQAGEDEKNLILYRGSLCFVIINRYPYNTGHLMVSPYRHISCVTLLDQEENNEMNELTRKCVEFLRADKSPHGFNIGINLGKCAGAGFEDHIHTHIVPRWHGDTNFMQVLADTRVHPEELQALYNRLGPCFQKLKS